MRAAGLRTAAAVACAEGVGAEVVAGARPKSKSQGLVGLKAHVVVANWALVAICPRHRCRCASLLQRCVYKVVRAQRLEQAPPILQIEIREAWPAVHVAGGLA